jgi:hypothetical protein
LTAFKAHFMKTARTRLLTFMTTAACFAQATTNAASYASLGVLTACTGFNRIELHLSLAFQKVIDLVDHAAHRWRIFQFYRVVQAAQT